MVGLLEPVRTAALIGADLGPGDRVLLQPVHVDPTVAYHERLLVVDQQEVVEEWEIDLRGW